MWIKRKVQHGTKTGRKIGFPTLNLTVGNFNKTFADGVYRCQIKIDSKIYKGALYFGPRLNGRKKVLEIFVIDFNKTIYGKFISFKIGKKIRSAKQFDNLDELKKQIERDLKNLSS